MYYEKYEKRLAITCDICGSEMAFHKSLLRSVRGDHIYLTFVCPRRKGEKGCGATKNIRFDRDPDIKYRRTVSGSFVRV